MEEIEIKVTFSWDRFIEEDFNLFIWEAFVSKGSKSETHEVAASLLRIGISNDRGMLSEACVVIKA